MAMDIVDEMSRGKQGLEVGKQINLLLTIPDFSGAFKAGTLSVMIARYGALKVLDDPIVIRAINHAEVMSDIWTELEGKEPSPDASICSALNDLYFYKKVQELEEQDA